MKKYLLLLFMVLSTVAFGQTLSRTAVFDFSNPQGGLWPKVTPDGYRTDISKQLFTSGDIQVSFGNEEEGSVSPGVTLDANPIKVGIDSGKVDYTCHVFPYGTVTFKGLNEATFNKIVIRDGDYLGNVRLKDGQQGTFDNVAYTWESNGATVNTLTLKNTGGNAGDIHTFTVYYSVPAVRLMPFTVSPSNGEALAAFNGLKLSYDQNLTLVSTDGITISYNGAEQKVTTSVSGSQVTLTPANSLTSDGTVSVYIPAGCFSDASGYLNKALSYTFTVKESRNTFMMVASDPDENTPLKALPATIELTYPKTQYGFSIGYVDSNKELKLKDASGSTVCGVAIAAKSGDESKVTLTVQNNVSISVKGTYSITIPEKTIFNHQGDSKDGGWIPDPVDGRWNPEFTLTFVVDPGYVPDTSTMKMKACRALLQNTGVGYPALISEGYKALQDSVANNATDEGLDVALAKYYAETNVVMPTTGKFYKLAGVNLSGTKLYLCYDNGAVTLSADTAKVAHFLATTDGSTVKLATADGKYLNVLTSSTDYDAASSKNVTDAETAASSLTFAKLVSTDHAKEALGKMTMYGLLGKDKNDIDNKDVSAYAIIRYTDNTIKNNPTAIRFEDNLSSAFIFEETTKGEIKPSEPTVDSTAVKLEPDLSVAKASDGSVVLTLDFRGTGYTVNSEKTSGEFIKDESGKTTTVQHAQSATEANMFTITLKSLADGKYTLVIPKGSLVAIKDNKEQPCDRIELSFTVGSGSGSDPDTPSTPDGEFNYDMDETSIFFLNGQYYHDVDLNECIIYHAIGGIYDDLYPDTTKVVRLNNANGETIRTGKLTRYTGDKINASDTKAMVVVLDTPIKAGDLKTGVYTFVFEQGYWGDSNFGKYKRGEITDASICHANPRRIIPVNVNNVLAGIAVVKDDRNQEPVIYDLTGRRLKSMSKPGLYIVNGKKVIKR